jgi:hypothetical protein
VPPYPEPTPIFHITAIDNLRSIAKASALLSKRLMVATGLVCADIAYQQIQGRRALKAIPIAPRGTLHDYVPCPSRDAPRLRPVLFRAPLANAHDHQQRGNVAGCDYRQDDIVHLQRVPIIVVRTPNV